jgi:EAL domain-containing protein (putative c-di-GMP-specific phosphodiesterase class I)
MNNSHEPPSTGFALNASVWFFAGQMDETEQVKHVPIRSTPFLIGRRHDLALSIPCSCISKVHAELFDRDGDLWLRDLGSTNGTYVNGARITKEIKLREGDIVQFATVVFRVRQENSKNNGPENSTIREDACDRALAMVQFERLIHDRAVVPFYQPIVRLDQEDTETVGFEVLGRSRLFGLRTPKEMFATATQLNLESELSRVFRSQGIEVAKDLSRRLSLFVNTHPVELVEDGLFTSLHELRKLAPDRPMTLEIHEATVTDPKTIRSLQAILRDLDMELAFDDFGAGQARLLELTEVRPDYIKFDMKLIQGIHQAPPSRQQVVALLAKMVNELEIVPLAEGVETRDEDETLRQMGFRMGQGFYYGHPASISTYSKTD